MTSSSLTLDHFVKLLQDIPIVQTIFNADASLEELLLLVGCIAIFWGFFFYFFGLVLGPIVKGQPWLHAAGSRDYDRGGKEMYEALGIPVNREEFIERFKDQWPWMQGVFIQHFIGGALCLPAILNIGDPHIQDSLACLSILSELGWEIEDLTSWIYKRYFVKGGQAKVPLGMIALLALHHSLTLILGLPLILNYRTNYYVHWLTFDLQCAGAVALFVTEYTKLLDVSIPNQLRQFQFLSGFALVVVIITRVFHWFYFTGCLIVGWYQEQAWIFVVVGSICTILFSVFNWFFCIDPFYKRFVKFMKVSADYTKLPATADAQTRRASLISLQEAAHNVMVGSDEMTTALVDVLRRNYVRDENKSNRRDTMPPSMFGSGRRVSSGSAAMMRSSMGNISLALSQLQMAGDLSEDLKED